MSNSLAVVLQAQLVGRRLVPRQWSKRDYFVESRNLGCDRNLNNPDWPEQIGFEALDEPQDHVLEHAEIQAIWGSDLDAQGAWGGTLSGLQWYPIVAGPEGELVQLLHLAVIWAEIEAVRVTEIEAEPETGMLKEAESVFEAEAEELQLMRKRVKNTNETLSLTLLERLLPMMTVVVQKEHGAIPARASASMQAAFFGWAEGGMRDRVSTGTFSFGESKATAPMDGQNRGISNKEKAGYIQEKASDSEMQKGVTTADFSLLSTAGLWSGVKKKLVPLVLTGETDPEPELLFRALVSPPTEKTEVSTKGRLHWKDMGSKSKEAMPMSGGLRSTSSAERGVLPAVQKITVEGGRESITAGAREVRDSSLLADRRVPVSPLPPEYDRAKCMKFKKPDVEREALGRVYQHAQGGNRLQEAGRRPEQGDAEGATLKLDQSLTFPESHVDSIQTDAGFLTQQPELSTRLPSDGNHTSESTAINTSIHVRAGPQLILLSAMAERRERPFRVTSVCSSASVNCEEEKYKMKRETTLTFKGESLAAAEAKQPLGCIPVTVSESSLALCSLEGEDYALKQDRVTQSCEVSHIQLKQYTVVFSILYESPTIPHPQHLPPLLELSGTVPRTKHRASKPKETVGRAVKRGLPLHERRAVYQHVPFTPQLDPLGPVPSRAREVEETEKNVRAPVKRLWPDGADQHINIGMNSCAPLLRHLRTPEISEQSYMNDHHTCAHSELKKSSSYLYCPKVNILIVEVGTFCKLWEVSLGERESEKIPGQQSGRSRGWMLLASSGTISSASGCRPALRPLREEGRKRENKDVMTSCGSKQSESCTSQHCSSPTASLHDTDSLQEQPARERVRANPDQTDMSAETSPHTPWAAGWLQPSGLRANVKCQHLIKEHRAACGIRELSKGKIKEKRIEKNILYATINRPTSCSLGVHVWWVANRRQRVTGPVARNHSRKAATFHGENSFHERTARLNIQTRDRAVVCTDSRQISAGRAKLEAAGETALESLGLQRKLAWSGSAVSILAKIAFWSSLGERRYSRAEKRTPQSHLMHLDVFCTQVKRGKAITRGTFSVLARHDEVKKAPPAAPPLSDMDPTLTYCDDDDIATDESRQSLQHDSPNKPPPGSQSWGDLGDRGWKRGESLEKAVMRSCYFKTGKEPCACLLDTPTSTAQILRVVLKSLELVKEWASFGVGLLNFDCTCGVPPVGWNIADQSRHKRPRPPTLMLITVVERVLMEGSPPQSFSDSASAQKGCCFLQETSQEGLEVGSHSDEAWDELQSLNNHTGFHPTGLPGTKPGCELVPSRVKASEGARAYHVRHWIGVNAWLVGPEACSCWETCLVGSLGPPAAGYQGKEILEGSMDEGHWEEELAGEEGEVLDENAKGVGDSSFSLAGLCGNFLARKPSSEDSDVGPIERTLSGLSLPEDDLQNREEIFGKRLRSYKLMCVCCGYAESITAGMCVTLTEDCRMEAGCCSCPDFPARALGLAEGLRRLCLLTKQAASVLKRTAAARKQMVATMPATTGRARPSSGTSGCGKNCIIKNIPSIPETELHDVVINWGCVIGWRNPRSKHRELQNADNIIAGSITTADAKLAWSAQRDEERGSRAPTGALASDITAEKRVSTEDDVIFHTSIPLLFSHLLPITLHEQPESTLVEETEHSCSDETIASSPPSCMPSARYKDLQKILSVNSEDERLPLEHITEHSVSKQEENQELQQEVLFDKMERSYNLSHLASFVEKNLCNVVEMEWVRERAREWGERVSSARDPFQKQTEHVQSREQCESGKVEREKYYIEGSPEYSGSTWGGGPKIDAPCCSLCNHLVEKSAAPARTPLVEGGGVGAEIGYLSVALPVKSESSAFQGELEREVASEPQYHAQKRRMPVVTRGFEISSVVEVFLHLNGCLPLKMNRRKKLLSHCKIAGEAGEGMCNREKDKEEEEDGQFDLPPTGNLHQLLMPRAFYIPLCIVTVVFLHQNMDFLE
ncbi:hypothetical protein DNTS_006705, partial [Danionella cerebrum]